MASTDVPAVVARLVAIIQSVPDIGLVHAYDPMDRDDLQPLLVSVINGVPTMRAWWVSGPTMRATHLTQAVGGFIERQWTYEVHGIEGVVDGGATRGIQQLRANALAVTDALDLDRNLASTALRTEACRWATGPDLRSFAGDFVAAYLVIEKDAITVTTP